MSNILPFSNNLNEQHLNSPLINSDQEQTYFCKQIFCNLTYCNFNNLRYNFKKLYQFVFCIPEINLENSDDYQNLDFNQN
jgi:hypothetical protein